MMREPAGTQADPNQSARPSWFNLAAKSRFRKRDRNAAAAEPFHLKEV
jgi:hypothetical protein